MTISTLDTNTVTPNNEIIKQRSHEQDDSIGSAQESSFDQAKALKNASIIESQIAVSLKSGDESMSLLYKTVLSSINDELATDLGPNAIEKAYENEVDVSPQATADRIVKSATAFYSSFKEQHPELSDDEALDNFIDIISQGIDTGFDDAKEILDGLSVLEGEIEENISSTYDLVQLGLTDFRKQLAAVEAEVELQNRT